MTYTHFTLLGEHLVNVKLQKCHSVNQFQFLGTYISVLAASSHVSVDVADAALRANDQRGASVHDSLATTIAGHNLTIDGNTERETQENMSQTDAY